MKKFSAIYFDLTGNCNANCPFCKTGLDKIKVKNFVIPERFEKGLQKLKDIGVIENDSVVSLYNWGEPFLHPDINKIVGVVNKLDVKYALSTNTSIFHEIRPEFVKNLRHFIFSMPGFSQDSYGRIHGFQFEKIRGNIERFVYTARDAGYGGVFTIFYHVYQFNVLEIPAARRFADSLGITLNPYLAIMNDWHAMNQMVDGSLSYANLLRSSSALFLHNFDGLIQKSPAGYKCPQWEYLTIDEDCNVLVCCQTPKYDPAYILGNVLTDDFADVLEKRKNHPVCNACLQKGLAYYINNSMEHFPIENFQLSRIAEDRVATPSVSPTKQCFLNRIKSIFR